MALHVTICSPVGKQHEKFIWNSKLDDGNQNDNVEIVDSVRWIVSEMSELNGDKEIQNSLKEIDTNKFTDVKHLCDLYNHKIALLHQCIGLDTIVSRFNTRASTLHLKHIISQCYNRAVEDPDVLNKYEAFSPEVYGETSFELVDQMIAGMSFTENDSFVDLGSGVGQVVLQVAAATNVKRCTGIEKADMPAKYAKEMEIQFRKLMAFYGKTYQEFKLFHDDFLAESNRETITQSTIIFVNNFAFGPRVDHELKERFGQLKEGARIVSSKVFCPLNFRITDRNLGDIGSILAVRPMSPLESAVSWTDTPFAYYVHTVDFSLLENYFAALKNPELKQTIPIRRDRLGRPLKVNTFKDGARGNDNTTMSAPTSAVTSRQSSQLDLTDLMAASSEETSSAQQSEDSRNPRSLRARAVKLEERRRKRELKRKQKSLGVVDQQHDKARIDSHRNNLSLLHSTTVQSFTDRQFDSSKYNVPVLSAYHDDYLKSGQRVFNELNDVRAAHDLSETAYMFDRELDTMVSDEDIEDLLNSFRCVLMAYKRQSCSPQYKSFLINKVRELHSENVRLRESMKKMQHQVKLLQDDGLVVLQRRLNELGIKADKPSQFFQASRKAIGIHGQYKTQKEQLRQEVERLERMQQMGETPVVVNNHSPAVANNSSLGLGSLLDNHLTQMIRNALNSDPPTGAPVIRSSQPNYSPISNGGSSLQDDNSPIKSWSSHHSYTFS